jgi:alkaline phosphatase
MVTRREFVGGASALAISAVVAPEAAPVERGIRIGLCADPHYADTDTRGARHYRLSLGRMREAAETWNSSGVDLAVELGDYVDSAAAPDVDEELASLRAIEAEFCKVKARRCHVIGNHCVATIPKARFLRAVGQRKACYSFDRAGVHCVVLDACFRRDGVAYGDAPFDWTDCDVPQAQREWLAADLAKTRLPTVVFVHQRLDLPVGNHYAVHSSPEVRAVLERSGGVPYIALDAMVDGDPKAGNAFSILHVATDGGLRLEGFGRHAAHPLA